MHTGLGDKQFGKETSLEWKQPGIRKLSWTTNSLECSSSGNSWAGVGQWEGGRKAGQQGHKAGQQEAGREGTHTDFSGPDGGGDVAVGFCTRAFLSVSCDFGKTEDFGQNGPAFLKEIQNGVGTLQAEG